MGRASAITSMCLTIACGGAAPPDRDATRIDAGASVDASDGTGDAAPQRSCLAAGTPGCGLALIAGGTFTIGELADAGGVDDSPPQAHITVSAFVIDRFEVTIARFTAFWNAEHPAPAGRAVDYPGHPRVAYLGDVAEPLTPTTGPPECNWTVAGRDAHPINCIDWPTAQAFCVWDGGRLPTAAEWELAARGEEDRTYPWGDAAPDDTLACGTATHGTCPVGAHPAGDTPEGVHDMAGNVREWNADWYMPYTDSRCWGGIPQTDPLCTHTAMNAHDIVGGSWVNALDPQWLHAASRYWGVGAYVPGEGVRCARTP